MKVVRLTFSDMKWATEEKMPISGNLPPKRATKAGLIWVVGLGTSAHTAFGQTKHNMNTDLFIRNFWASVEKAGPTMPHVPGITPCWRWLGRKSAGGYGVLNKHTKDISAHRASWLLHRGPIPKGMCILHRCDNPECVNIEHLWIGTHADNVADKVSKGRQPKGDNHGMRMHPECSPRGKEHYCYKIPGMLETLRARIRNAPRVIGSNHPHAKLTEDQVFEIKAARRGGATQHALAKQFGVGRTTIQNILRGEIWRHVHN